MAIYFCGDTSIKSLVAALLVGCWYLPSNLRLQHQPAVPCRLDHSSFTDCSGTVGINIIPVRWRCVIKAIKITALLLSGEI